MTFEVKVPGVGESVQEGMISRWCKKDGDYVEKDEIICELETDKATVEIPADRSGIIEIICKEDSVVKVGQIIAKIKESSQTSPNETANASSKKTSAPVSDKIDVAPDKTPSSSVDNSGPAVRRILAETGENPSSYIGTGRDGRITKSDIIKQNLQAKSTSADEKTNDAEKESNILAEPTNNRSSVRKPMSMLRRRIAERLIESQKTAAILTTFNEVDMGAIIEARSKYKELFEKSHGVKLGFMGFFLKACVKALREFPLVNASIDKDQIIYHNYCDIGVAVSTKKGLMVPVVRNVEALSVAGIEKEIMNYSLKAKENKIGLDDLSGGTFTVSNGGVFGSLLSTPIINPPQTAILGMHKIQKRPMVQEDGNISARPMMYLALSYDHRLIDGKEAVQFLVSIKNSLEDPNRMLLEL